MEPRFEGSAGLVENRACRGRYLMTTPRASERLAATDGMKAIGLGAFRARPAVRIPLIKDVLEALSIRFELLVEIFNRVFRFHTSKLTQGVRQRLSNPKLLVVKGESSIHLTIDLSWLFPFRGLPP
jgi:hypothetical protein